MDSKNKTKLTSSEELCAEFYDLVEDENNTAENEDKIVICTLDVEKYYPSMNIDDCAEIVEQEWLKSDLLKHYHQNRFCESCPWPVLAYP